jgi:RNA 3'-terminal phosphate cyclase (ATP)
MIIIDGSSGEGGGQVLRTALGLSLVTGQAFRIENIRAGRAKPGLMRQHLTAVRAAAEISQARISGDTIGSRELEFEPSKAQSGSYEFAVGTAGSATLVLQTVLPALTLAARSSRLILKGGTHNPWSPPFDFLEKSLAPLLNRMGPTITLELIRPGFYPAGGGEFQVNIKPADKLERLEIMERGEILGRRARAVVAKLSNQVAERELKVVEKKLGWSRETLAIERRDSSMGPGNILMLEIESRYVTEVITAFGEHTVRAEAVAARAVDEAREYLAAGAPVGKHLADQLLVPLALAGGKFRTVAPTRHTMTNIDVIKQFMKVEIAVTRAESDGAVWEINVGEGKPNATDDYNHP